MVTNYLEIEFGTQKIYHLAHLDHNLKWTQCGKKQGTKHYLHHLVTIDLGNHIVTFLVTN